MDKTTLHVVCICSQERVVALQIFENHPNSVDMHHFVWSFLEEIKAGKRTRPVMILLDNAGWHLANIASCRRASTRMSSCTTYRMATGSAS